MSLSLTPFTPFRISTKPSFIRGIPTSAIVLT
nr:MAG TPA: hypothetical protein [Caudoviricetes sp.]